MQSSQEPQGPAEKLESLLKLSREREESMENRQEDDKGSKRRRLSQEERERELSLIHISEPTRH
eukprot:10874343-Karenia_brevis.AAC.1